MIKVLIVDDSSVVRNLLQKIFSTDPGIEVVGTAMDPFQARELLIKCKPDVMTLDLEMPRMDGITFLQKVMVHSPVRTIVLSTLSKPNSELALRAYEVGAIDVMEKPAIDLNRSLSSLGAQLISRVKTVAASNIVPLSKYKAIKSAPPVNLTQTTHQILAIASSTGGTQALRAILSALPPNSPGILVVQHMPTAFTGKFAFELDKLCRIKVKEAEKGDRVLPGHAYIAPGNFHMTVSRSGHHYILNLNQEPQVHHVRPAADILMVTVAKAAGKNAIGLVLSGMGKDGARGLLRMKEAGSFNIAQDEKSAVTYGMAGESLAKGAIHEVVDLSDIAGVLVSQFKKREVA